MSLAGVSATAVDDAAMASKSASLRCGAAGQRDVGPEQAAAAEFGDLAAVTTLPCRHGHGSVFPLRERCAHCAAIASSSASTRAGEALAIVTSADGVTSDVDGTRTVRAPESAWADNAASRWATSSATSHQSTTVVIPASRAWSKPTNVAAYTSSGVKWPDMSASDVAPRLRVSDCHRWRCASTKPGMTIVSEASTTSALRVRSDGPTSLMIPSSIRMSAPTMLPTARSSDSTVPPLMSTLPFIDSTRPPWRRR